ncbi:MAG: hypothetical protein U0Q16_29960 [Bryobacteraceae bacterium]
MPIPASDLAIDPDTVLLAITQAAGTGSTALTARAVRSLIASTQSMRGGWPAVCTRLQAELRTNPRLTARQLDEAFGSERVVRVALSSGVPLRSIHSLLTEAIPRIIPVALEDEAGLLSSLEAASATSIVPSEEGHVRWPLYAAASLLLLGLALLAGRLLR